MLQPDYKGNDQRRCQSEEDNPEDPYDSFLRNNPPNDPIDPHQDIESCRYHLDPELLLCDTVVVHRSKSLDYQCKNTICQSIIIILWNNQGSASFSPFYKTFCGRPHFPIRGLPRFHAQEATSAPNLLEARGINGNSAAKCPLASVKS